jgi:ketosteroid isomerase-like protein
MTDVAAAVREAASRWSEAIANRDVAACEQFLGEEYALMAPGVGEVPRAAWLAMLPEYVIRSYEFRDVRVHAYGDTAVMRSRYHQTATVQGKDRSGAMLVTDVWVHRDGRWQVVARHTSFL